jgi:malonyl-CoA O-methyltransferase
VRRRRSRLADGYRDAARVPRELGERILEHLDPVRLSPRRVLELGAAAGDLRRALERRYPDARIVSSDDCLELLSRGRPSRWRRRRAGLLCAEPHALPVAAGSIDMLVCNLAAAPLHRHEAALRDWRRVMRSGGVVTIATLGPLSFIELAETWARLDGGVPHLHPFPDMHDLGDALVRAGFGDVVMDSQRLQVEFDDVAHLLRELRTVGGGNASPQRRKSLTTPRELEALARAYPRDRPGGACLATVEAVFAHAWALEPAGLRVSPPARGP